MSLGILSKRAKRASREQMSQFWSEKCYSWLTSAFDKIPSPPLLVNFCQLLATPSLAPLGWRHLWTIPNHHVYHSILFFSNSFTKLQKHKHKTTIQHPHICNIAQILCINHTIAYMTMQQIFRAIHVSSVFFNLIRTDKIQILFVQKILIEETKCSTILLGCLLHHCVALHTEIQSAQSTHFLDFMKDFTFNHISGHLNR